MNSDRSAKEDIKRAADAVELIGQFVQLKKAGRNFVGLCPFHAEKAPSFTVSPERQTFHCFGCKKGGDIFTFWMEYHGATFPEALKDLGERYHVTVPERTFSPAERKKAALRETLFQTNEKAAAFFAETLGHTVIGKPGRDYLSKRSIPDETVSEFRLGYAPAQWDGLVKFFRRQQWDQGLALKAGLIIPKKGGGYYDRFRGRLMFPILDLRDRVVGFGGRVLDDSLPKYVNTPETPVFHKGDSPYGLHASFRAIRESQRVVIVEGYMDLLALRSRGLNEVVASLGTALTTEHIRRLKGYAREAIIVFDSDEAGKAAAVKSLPFFLNEGLSAKAVVLPDGHDPDSFVSSKGLNPFLELLDRAPAMFDFFLDQKLPPKEADVESKVRVLKEVLPVLSSLHNEAQRTLYVRRLSEHLGIREEVVLSELGRVRKSPSNKAAYRDLEGRLSASRVGKSLSDLQVLNLLIHYPDSLSRLMACDCRVLLSSPVVREIVDTIFKQFAEQGPSSPEGLMEALESGAAREQLREILHRPFIVYSDEDAEQAVREFEEKANQKQFMASLRKAKGDAQAQNRLIQSRVEGPTRANPD
ncbi:MAG: DNA primase [Deltaproteobacteria bacterium]|nr:DNA primase [Deltaproteobacteria bacterium]